MQVNTKDFWNSCLALIEKEISRADCNTWFKNTYILKEDSGTVIVGVPNEFVRDWLKNKYEKMILKAIIEHADHVRSVEFEIAKGEPKVGAIETKTSTPEKFTSELPLKDLYINKEDNLNPRYTFDTFIVGGFNELAYAASQAILKRPGQAYNPFFVYGETGLGKTHLLQATGNAIKQNHPEKKVFYTTLEKFAIDYIQSVQTNKPYAFKEKYRKYDVLILDDIQFITGKDKTQEELFHLFNELYEQNKQIIFSSDKHPNYIPGLEDRLRSRFGSGMIVDVNEPDIESKIAIIKAKLEENGINISDEVIDYIASSISGSIRELEGTLNTIICQNQFKKRDLSLIEVKKLIKNNIKPKKNVSVQNIVKIISDFYNIAPF